jgi:hypothetical protein
VIALSPSESVLDQPQKGRVSRGHYIWGYLSQRDKPRLSDHAHWSYEVHVKNIVYQKELLGHLFASAYFIATSLLIALLITNMFLNYTKHLLERCDTTDCEKRKYLAVLVENTGAIGILVDQVNAGSGGDEQIAYLAAMLN